MWDAMWDRLASRLQNASFCWEDNHLLGAGTRQRTRATRLFLVPGRQRNTGRDLLLCD
jgi:hypothetical protein